MFNPFQKLFRKNLNRSRLGCKNSTFRGVDANDFWEKYGGADDCFADDTS
jgi:hypothetical protein